MRKLNIATVFSGIGAFEFALRRLSIQHDTIFACDNGERDIDINVNTEMEVVKSLKTTKEKMDYVFDLYRKNTRKTNFIQQTYECNYGHSTKYFFQDIRLLDGNDFKNSIDIFVGGSPCQSFSTVGTQKGLDDARGTLFYDFARLVSEIKPKVFIFENVRGLYTHDKKNTWGIIKRIFEDDLGYKIHHKLLNSKHYGIPQNRTRLFVVGFLEDVEFDFPDEIQLKYKLDDFRIDKVSKGNFYTDQKGEIKINYRSSFVDDTYKLSKKIEDYVLKPGTKNFYQKPEIDLSIARPILKTMGNNHRAGIDNYFSFENGIRMLTEREALRLMGFTDDFKICVSKSQVYKQAGNSIVVDILMKIVIEIFKTKIFQGRE